MLDIIMNYQDIEELKKKYGKNSLQSYSWKCGQCGEEHDETEIRNLFRRKYICSCYSSNVEQVREKLKNAGWELISYQTNKQHNIDRSDPTTEVKCLNCGKKKYGCWINLVRKTCKCDCDSSKKIKNMISIEEFYNKWPLYNKQHFKLLSQKYSGRNSKYIIECKKCKRKDSRWGISLLNNEIKCKYCSRASIGEQKIIDILEENNISYVFQYPINTHNHRLYFDFFVPNHSCLIEFDGIQHFLPFEHFGGEERFKKQCEYDSLKNEYCKMHNIKLIRIKYLDSDKEIYDKLSWMFND